MSTILYKKYVINKDKEKELKDFKYPVYTTQDRDKWLDIIKKTYGKYGEVTVEEKPDDRPPSTESILGQSVAQLNLQNIQLNQTVDMLGKALAESQLEIMTLKGGND